MTRTKVQIEKETKKAYLIVDAEGRKGWIQKRWLGDDGTVAEKTMTKAAAGYTEKEQARAEAKEFANAYHAITNIVKQTAKAVAVKVMLDFCDVEQCRDSVIWIPKSLVKDGAVQGWFVTKKINEMLDEYRMNFSRYGSVIVDSVGVEDFEDCYAM